MTFTKALNVYKYICCYYVQTESWILYIGINRYNISLVFIQMTINDSKLY